MSRAARLAFAALTFAVAAAGPVRAQQRAIAVTTVGSDGCPAAEAVAKAVAEILPAYRVSADADEDGTVVVRLTDEGERYRVSVGGSINVAGAERIIADPGRRCGERAGTAAVFVALTLQPPSVTLDDKSRAPPPPSPPPPPPRPITPSRPFRFDLDVSALFALGPRSPAGESVVAYGGGLRARFGRGILGVTVGAALFAPATLSLAGGAAELLRLPLDADLEVALRRPRWELSGELGIAATFLRARGQGFAVNETATGWELGIRGAIVARFWWARRFGIRIALSAIAAPSPSSLTVARAGTVGETLPIWLGADAGLVVRFR